MIRKNFRNIIIGVLAFAVAIYVLFFKGRHIYPAGGGHSRFKVETFSQSVGWGYRIRQDTTPVIEQKFIPGVAGMNGFRTEPEAMKVGELVRKKLDNGIFPPTVRVEELDSLGIVH